MIGWLTEKGRGNLEIPGWSGVQSLPRVLSLEQDEMYMRPLKEVEMLREGGECFNDLRIQGVWESPVRGKAAKILFLDYSVLEVFINDREQCGACQGRGCADQKIRSLLYESGVYNL